MTTPGRLALLSTCSESFAPFTGPFDLVTLEQWIKTELGDQRALDEPVPHGPIRTLARAPARLLHVVSGNTPHAAHQSLLRGLALGAHNTMKIPSSGLPALATTTAALPAGLAALVTLVPALPDDWTRSFDALVVFGNDETIAWFARHTPPAIRFVPHGERLSIALVTGAPAKAARLAAHDVSLFDQRGCLSIHDVYVDSAAGCSPSEFAARLAREMERFDAHTPRSPLTPSEFGAITNLRETLRFVHANDPRSSSLWESPGSTRWTVIYEADPLLKISCLNRVVFVKPWPPRDHLASLGPAARHLSTIALHPFDPDRALPLATLPATRLCPLGQTQYPSLFWHHDGLPPLASLVTWIDIG